MKATLVQFISMAILLGLGSWYLNPHEDHFSQDALRFTDVSQSSGCLNTHSMVRLSSQFDNIMPWLSSVGAAVSAGDFDNDGLVDFYVTNSGPGSSNRLFHNIGNGKFKDVALEAGVAGCNRSGASMDAMFFDYDNDGDEDLYVVKWGAPNILFENQGDGTFEDVTARAGVGFWGYANGVIAFDYDRDGLPDIFVANYFADSVLGPATGSSVRNDLWHPVTTRVMHTTFTHAVNGGRNVLYKNMGDGTFKDVTVESGLGHTGWSLDAGSGDLNNDGWPDLYVANDFGADELYFNTGASEFPPRFRRVIDPDGHPGIGNDWWKGMNVDIADVDGNGQLDIYVTNILARRYKTDEGNMLWLNLPDQSMVGGCKFVNVSPQVGTNDGGWGWGGKFCDLNNDGLMDIFTVNGFATGKDSLATYWYQLQEMVTQTKNNAADAKDWPAMGDRDLSGYEPSRLFLQAPQPSGRKTAPVKFIERAAACGVTDLYNGRGIALADYDNDGAVDLYIANQGAPNCLYHNELYTKTRIAGSDRQGPHWIGFFLVGDPNRARDVGDRILASSRDALGARIEIWSNGLRQIRELTYCNGFASESERRVIVGTGNSSSIESVEITWPSGRKEEIQGNELAVDRYHTIIEGLTTPHLAGEVQR